MKENKDGNKQEISILLNNLKQEKSDDKKKIIFEELYKKYSNIVYKIAFSILKNEDNAKDIMQCVFLKIYKIPKENLPSTGEMSWLYTVTKNEALNYINKKYNKDISLNEVSDISKECLELQKVLEDEKINRLLKNLNDEEKEIVKLKIIGNFSFKEIAKMLGKSESTIKWKYYKSLNIIKVLITNIAICVISLGIYIKLKNNNRKANINQLESNEQTNITIDVKENETQTDSAITSNKEENGKEENTFEYEQNIELENITVQESQELNKDNTTNIEVLETAIFLVLLISIISIFASIVILIKNKIKNNKKV